MANLPFLVLVTGRNLESVEFKLKSIATFASEVDLDFVSETCRGLNFNESFRGILLIHNGIVISQKVVKVTRRQLVLFMSSISTEWLGMGTALRRIPQFRKTIEDCASILSKHGIDIMARFNSSDPLFAFDGDREKFAQVNIIHIALVNVLQAVNIEYDYYVGNSLGEHCALYLNGGTIEQSVLTLFLRIKGLEDEKATKGFMAIIHNYGDDIPMPANVRRAAFFLPGVCLLSGPQTDLQLLKERSEQVGAVLQVPFPESYGHHHPGIAPFSDDVFKKFQDLLGEGLPRSRKWISSVFERDSQDERSKRADASYMRCIHTMPLLANESLRQVPKDSVLVSLDPSRMLTEIIDAIVGPSILVVTLMKRDTTEEEALLLLFESLATLFLEGQNINLIALYTHD